MVIAINHTFGRDFQATWTWIFSIRNAKMSFHVISRGESFLERHDLTEMNGHLAIRDWLDDVTRFLGSEEFDGIITQCRQ